MLRPRCGGIRDLKARLNTLLEDSSCRKSFPLQAALLNIGAVFKETSHKTDRVRLEEWKKIQEMNFSATIESYIDELFYNGDPLIMELFLVKNAALSIGIIFLYVIGAKLIGPELMENRPALNLRKPMIFYDLIMGLCNVYMVSYISYILFKHDLRDICSLARNEEMEESRMIVIGLMNKLFIMKFLEMFETAFFIGRKKFAQVSNLHVFHHASVPLLVLMSLRSQKRAAMLIYALVNCSIHVIMYSYYGFTAMGYNIKWKSYLTKMQIGQFIVMIPFMSFVAYSGCVVSTSSVIIHLVHTIVMFKMFMDFHNSKYKPGHASTASLNGATVQLKKLE